MKREGSPSLLHLLAFWATVCKTVRPIPSDRCLSCLSVMSVTLVYCGQTVGWVKMPLGMVVGLSPGHIVLDGQPALSPKEHSPHFLPISVVVKAAGWIKVSLGMEVDLSPGDFVRDGDSAPLPKKGAEPLPNFGPISVVAKRLDASRCHLIWR